MQKGGRTFLRGFRVPHKPAESFPRKRGKIVKNRIKRTFQQLMLSPSFDNFISVKARL